MNSLKAVAEMNRLGKTGIPFLFIIDFKMNSPIVIPLAEVDPSSILYKVNEIENYEDDLTLNKVLKFDKHPVSYDEYKKAFDVVEQNISAGNTYLLNLTFPTKIETNYSLLEIFNGSIAKYKLFFENKFVVFSPETFVTIRSGVIFSHPMKGTIDASIENAEQMILDDEKEKAEHITIVDLIRNDLSIVASDVKVDKFRYIEEVITNDKKLLQVSSQISGKMTRRFHESLGDIIFNLLPAGSISGAPKKKTLEIIEKVENYERGYYTGIFGIFDGENLDSAVMIRFIENINGELYYKSGGGVTFMSNPEQEYQELIDKVYVPIF